MLMIKTPKEAKELNVFILLSNGKEKRNFLLEFPSNAAES
jgi:hypothetical protein